MPTTTILDSWLRELVPHDLSPSDVASTLTHLGVEVEGVVDTRSNLDGLVVGEVLTKESHPNADRLSLCTVRAETNGEALDVICGAPNVEAGQKVVFAPVGTELKEVGFTIDTRTIRGIVSNGMICSEKELGLSDNHEGIIVLPEDAEVGTPVADFLGDVAYEIDLTPDRGDCASHIGTARELAASADLELMRPDVSLREFDPPASKSVSVEIEDPELCRRYAARVVQGVKIGPSPDWIQRRLKGIGVRPINNVVDIASLVMFECGHPLHAFDFGAVEGRKIVVRTSKKGETFTTLDSKERTLPPDTLLICDAKKPVAIAGIMGGENSEIDAESTDVLIESAWFDPSSIRRSAKALQLSTDASYRFERGADIDVIPYAADRAAQLMADIGGGTVRTGLVDAYPGKREQVHVQYRPTRSNQLLGHEIPTDRQYALLERLGFERVEEEDSAATISIPTWRNDVFGEVDLIEEVARLDGYENVPVDDEIHFPTRASEDPVQAIVDRSRALFVGNGFSEIVEPYQTDPDAATRYGNGVELRNALGRDSSFMRTTLMTGLGRVIAHNRRYGRGNLRLFEIGKVFRTTQSPGHPIEGIAETLELAFSMSGKAEPSGFDLKERDADVFDARATLERYLSHLGLPAPRYDIAYEEQWGFDAPAIKIYVGDDEIGRTGSFDSWIESRYDCGSGHVLTVIDLDRLSRIPERAARYVPPPQYPSVTRDLSLLAPAERQHQDIVDTIHQAGPETLRSIELFDIYEGKGIDPGKKSMSYRLTFRSDEETLRDADVDGQIEAVVGALKSRLGIELRG